MDGWREGGIDWLISLLIWGKVRALSLHVFSREGFRRDGLSDWFVSLLIWSEITVFPYIWPRERDVGWREEGSDVTVGTSAHHRHRGHRDRQHHHCVLHPLVDGFLYPNSVYWKERGADSSEVVISLFYKLGDNPARSSRPSLVGPRPHSPTVFMGPIRMYTL